MTIAYQPRSRSHAMFTNWSAHAMTAPLTAGLIALVSMTSANADDPSRKALKNTLGMTFVRIPDGTFSMREPLASEKSESPSDITADETPWHLVNISKPFYMGAHEVT